MDERKFILRMIARADGRRERINNELMALRHRIAELRRSEDTLARILAEERWYANKIRAVGENVIDGKMSFDEFLDALNKEPEDE